MAEERRKRKTAHEMIMEMREALNMPEEEGDPQEDAVEELMRQWRVERLETTVTYAEYTAKYNREAYTDRWLGEGEDPDLIKAREIVYGKKEEEEEEEEKPKKKKTTHELWREKYVPKVKTIYLPAEKKESKKIKKARKKRQKEEIKTEEQELWQKKVDTAYWFLESYLKPEYAEYLYMKYRKDVNGLVEFCYDFCVEWRKIQSYHEISEEEFLARREARMKEEAEVVEDVGGLKFKRLEVAEKHRQKYETDPRVDAFPDIPDEYWDEFEEYCNTHRLRKFKKKARRNGIGPMGMRRICFLKKINKRNKSWRKGIMKRDYMLGSSFISKKEWDKECKKRLKEAEKQRKEYFRLLDDMAEKGELPESWVREAKGDTKRIKDMERKLLDEEYERRKIRYKEDRRLWKKKMAVHNAKLEWYKKQGADWDHRKLTIVADDGQEIEVSVINPGAPKPIIKVIEPGSTRYSEMSLDEVLDIHKAPEEPTPPKKIEWGEQYWAQYNELPDDWDY